MSENVQAQTAGPKPISLKARLLYGFGDYAFSTMTNVETFYFNFFLTNVAKFAPGIAMTIGLITSTIDAALSWIYGGILNTIKPGKFGRYRTLLVTLPWIVPFIYVFQFVKVGDGPLSYVIITLGFIISHFIWNLPYVANVTLVSVCGGTPEGRAALSSSRATWNQVAGITFGYIFAFLAPIFGANLATRPATFQSYSIAAVAFVLGWFMVIGYFINFMATSGYEEIETKEDLAKRQSKTKASVGDMVKSLFQNPHLCFLIIAMIPAWVIRFVPNGVVPYYFNYVANNMGLMPRYILIVNLGAFAGAFLSGYIAKKLTNRNAMIALYILMVIGLMFAYFNFQNVWAVIAFMTLVQFAQGACYSIGVALYADSAVYSQWKTKSDSRGWIMGLGNLPLKVAIIGRPIIINTSLMIVGFNAAIAPADATLELKRSIAGALTLIPACIVVVGIFLFLFGYRLSREKVLQYQNEINERAKA
jgi:GPH family glycoside/pentoside/hexuronide:cation symporter